MGLWKVNDRRQVLFRGNLYGPGDTLEASDDEVTVEGISRYVTKKKTSPVADVKAQQSSSNKAQQSSDNKSK